MQPIVELKDVSVQFGQQKVHSGINLTMLPGQGMVLLGPSGIQLGGRRATNRGPPRTS